MMWFLALPRPLKGALLIFTGLFVLFAGIGIYMRLHDRALIRSHEAEVTQQVLETELSAERIANRNDEGRRISREIRRTQLEAAREDAIHEHPEETGLVAGPAVRAVLSELRSQAGEDRNADR